MLLSFIFLSFYLLHVVQKGVALEVDPTLSKTWGPGLNPSKLVFPARYFFVKLFDKNGNE